MARVLVTRRLPFPALDRLAAAGHELDVWPGELPPPPGELRVRAASADALLCLLTDRIDEDLLQAAPGLRAIAVLAVGTDNVDLEACARRAQGFDMSLVTTRDTDLAALLDAADFVTLHVPLTDATRHLVDADFLAHMKTSAILINTSRGGVVDQDALIDALREGTIAGAALDVTDPEPLPPDDPLLSAPNVIVVPHIGSATRTARERMADLAVDNLLAGLAGRPMPHQVNRLPDRDA